jgi:hypothetical protein
MFRYVIYITGSRRPLVEPPEKSTSSSDHAVLDALNPPSGDALEIMSRDDLAEAMKAYLSEILHLDKKKAFAVIEKNEVFATDIPRMGAELGVKVPPAWAKLYSGWQNANAHIGNEGRTSHRTDIHDRHTKRASVVRGKLNDKVLRTLHLRSHIKAPDILQAIKDTSPIQLKSNQMVDLMDAILTLDKNEIEQLFAYHGEDNCQKFIAKFKAYVKKYHKEGLSKVSGLH